MRTLPLLALAAACTTTAVSAPETDDPGEAARRGVVVDGCADIHVYAHNAADTRALIIDIKGDLALRASRAGREVEVAFQLPHPDVDIRFQYGRDLTINECTDAVYAWPDVRGEGRALGGELRALITPLDYAGTWDYPTQVQLELTGVEMGDAAGRGYVLPDTVLPPVIVGWFAG